MPEVTPSTTGAIASIIIALITAVLGPGTLAFFALRSGKRKKKRKYGSEDVSEDDFLEGLVSRMEGRAQSAERQTELVRSELTRWQRWSYTAALLIIHLGGTPEPFPNGDADA